MALDSYKTAFDNAYQDIFDKVLVAMKVANLRFEPALKYGQSIQRVLPNIDAVRVRTVTRGSASTVDSITDTTETLTVNHEKEAVFYISDGEVTQCGPLNPGEYFGTHIGAKVAADLDAKVFVEVLQAASDFDAGDLTTASSTGTALELTSTTVPQLVTRMPAKLKYRYNLPLSDMVFVIDSYSAADIAQYLLGKQFDVVESVFKNGYAGNISTAEVYISENLTSQAVLANVGAATVFTAAAQTLTINGVTFQLLSGTAVANAGDISFYGDTATATERGNVLVEVLNDVYTSVTNHYVALSDASAALLLGGGSGELSVSASAGAVTIKAIGCGKLAVSESCSGLAISTSPYIHCYFGKRGGIDVVVQDLSPVEMRKTSTMRGTNVFSSYLAGIRTFTDGSKKFLDVMILC